MNKSSEIKEIVWDADNTLWDWVSYAVPAYEAMSAHISKRTGIPEPKVAAAMKRFYTDMGTMENVFLIQGLHAMKFFPKDWDQQQIEKLTEEAQSIFSTVRENNLKLYEGAKEAFLTTMEKGIRNTILTDAPGIQAPMRLKHFKLFDKDQKKMRAFALKATKPKKLPQKFMAKQLRGKYKLPFQLRYINEEKPHTNLEKILHMTREDIRRHVIIIGDNFKKDMGLAQKYNCRGLHAIYGEANPELITRILRFAPTRIAKRNISIETTNHEPKTNNNLIEIIESPREILSKIGLGS